MTDIRPAPLTPPDCDMSGFPFMPLDVGRLLDSDLFALSTGDEWKAAQALWCKSWGQIPAGSVPDDERVLARLAGVSLSEWRQLSDMALRGWRACNDGRLYHPVVCEKALAAWIERLAFQKRSAAANAKKYSREFNSADFDAAIIRANDMLGRLSPKAAGKLRRSVVLAQGAEQSPTRSDAVSLLDPTGTEKAPKEIVDSGELRETTLPEERPRKRGARLPDNWAPSPALVAYGVKLGFAEAKVISIAERFRLHWHASSNRNAIKLDWDMAFQGWLRDDAEKLPTKTARPRSLGPRPF